MKWVRNGVVNTARLDSTFSLISLSDRRCGRDMVGRRDVDLRRGALGVRRENRAEHGLVESAGTLYTEYQHHGKHESI